MNRRALKILKLALFILEDPDFYRPHIADPDISPMNRKELIEEIMYLGKAAQSSFYPDQLEEDEIRAILTFPVCRELGIQP